jgi:hypothetical protein
MVGGSDAAFNGAVYDLSRLIEALTNSCCRGEGFSVFEVIDPAGGFTGERVRLCNGCRKEHPLDD